MLGFGNTALSSPCRGKGVATGQDGRTETAKIDFRKNFTKNHNSEIYLWYENLFLKCRTVTKLCPKRPVLGKGINS